ncbi:MAG: ABC transporter permease, partial [Paraglaciecola sp.]|nr:ABC transporter permease [Paraglaciecola sp.]
MFYPLSAFIGLRYAKASKGSHFIAFINFFSVAGIALGLMSLIVVLSVMNGFEGELKLRNLGITPHVMVQNKSDSDIRPGMFNHIEGVIASAQQIDSEGIVQSREGLEGVMLQGIDPNAMQRLSIIADNMLVGRLTDLVKGEYGIVIGRALSIKLNLRIGQQARLISSENSYFGPFGRIYSQRVFRVVGIFDMGSAL